MPHAAGSLSWLPGAGTGASTRPAHGRPSPRAAREGGETDDGYRGARAGRRADAADPGRRVPDGPLRADGHGNPEPARGAAGVEALSRGVGAAGPAARGGAVVLRAGHPGAAAAGVG